MPGFRALTTLLLLALAPTAHGQERTSEWNYVDERWPKHIGPLIEEKEPDAYIHQVVTKESSPLRAWNGREGARALDTVTACGVTFDGYLRQRPRGTYLIIIMTSEDKADHKLKWIPVEYRFDEGSPEYFLRRGGAPGGSDRKAKAANDIQDDTPVASGRPDIRTDEGFRRAHKYLFDEDENRAAPQNEQRLRGEPRLQSKFKYLEVVKFPSASEFADSEYLQIYLPWIDSCDDKPSFQFRRDRKQEVVWDYPLKSWVTAGFQGATPLHQTGWSAIDPEPGAYLKLSMHFPHHGFSAEVNVSSFKSASPTNTAAMAAFLKGSYDYAFWLTKGLVLTLDAGVRGVVGSGGFVSGGGGGGPNIEWEVPGSRHQVTGQRMIFEAGCDFQDYFNGVINTHTLQGAVGTCTIGLGLGW